MPEGVERDGQPDFTPDMLESPELVDENEAGCE